MRPTRQKRPHETVT